MNVMKEGNALKSSLKYLCEVLPGNYSNGYLRPVRVLPCGKCHTFFSYICFFSLCYVSQ